MNDVRVPARSAVDSVSLLSSLVLCLFLLVAVAPAARAYTVSTRTDFAAGTSSIAAATADIDWDGDADLAVANFGANSVTFRINDGSGGFGTGTSYAVGQGPYDVAMVDVNGDYRADIVTVNYWDNTVSVLINDGTGGFLAKVDHPCGGNPTGLGVGDLNGDGWPDIVAVNYWVAQVSVLLNNGSGGFGPPTAYATGAGPENVALGDIDGDGDLDLVVCNIDANSVSVLKNSGSGVFGPKTDYPTGLFPYSVALGDVNNDGILDVVTANATSGTVSVFLGAGAGTFGPKSDVAAGPGALWVKLADVDLDRRLDILTSNYGANDVSLLHGDGAGGFVSAGTFGVGNQPWGMTVTDLSGDGIVDVVVANNTDATASVLLGDLPGGFAVGDTAVAFKALDQSGVERSLGEFAGKWVFLDISTVWCGPCNAMATETQQTYDSWVSNPTVSFEYVTLLVEGQAPGGPSTQTSAQKWGCRYNIARPILHAEGRFPNTLMSYFQGIDGTAFPTSVVIDPQGKIRDITVDQLSGQQVCDKIAALAGVASPTLAPAPSALCETPPPPTPTDGVKVVWKPLSYAVLHITYDGVESTSSLSGTYDPDPVSLALAYNDWDISPGGVPTPQGQVYAHVDSISGIETVQVALFRLDGYDIATAHPYSVRMTDLIWPDGLERVVVPPTTPVVAAYYLQNHDLGGPETGFGTTLTPLYALLGSELDIASFDLSTVPGLPPQPWAWLVTDINLTHSVPLGVTSGGVQAAGRLVMGTPWPNPASDGTSLRWALPRSGRVRIEIVDVAGRRVRQVLDGALEAGPQVTVWNLRDDDGQRVHAGVYFARVRAGGETAVTRLAVVH